ncbi:MAG: hypothetical protein AAGE84_25050 [Cyanobacteria bacterium P01_G01_bin.39]
MLVHPTEVLTPLRPDAMFFFVQMIGLTDVLERFNLPVTSSEKQISRRKLCEDYSNEVHIGYSDCGL